MIYTDNPLDKAMASATPVYPAALGGTLPELPVGGHCYLLARDGLFLMGQGCGFYALIRLSRLDNFTSFGGLTEGVWLTHGPVPKALVLDAATDAIAESPDEWAGAIVLREGDYALESVSADSASPGHITYRRDSYDDAALVVDMHSHGAGDAYFSSTDDASDAEGVHISVVFGRCVKPSALTVVSRVTINGHFRRLDTTDWMSA